MKRLTTVRIAREGDILRMRQTAQVIARAAEFDTFSQTRAVTAWTELARNLLQHGGGGKLTLGMDGLEGNIALVGIASDQGPGIEEVEDLLAGRRRAATKGGLGLGLRGVHKMADGFDIDTGPEGTRIEARFRSELPEAKLLDYVRKATDALGTLGETDPAAALAQQNDELMRALAERDMLIREIHHRTGNNLALVASLVRLSRAGAKEAETRQVLQELEGRISAIVRVHQQLQHADTGGLLSLQPLLREVVDQARRAFSAPDLKIHATVDGDDAVVGSGAAVAVGLIVGELMTNALKHAFADRDEGTMTVSVDASDETQLKLVVADDGVGLPPDKDRPERSSSLGWRMIRSMVEKYGGSITTTSDDGLAVTVLLDRDLLAGE